ncbi:MAG: 3-methyl-2-oxobutanoate hydroxymethyltransferase [Chloroflexi bacterium]|nr:3-methyl-2-oxobutanoate hydroxymethyltransferase [Chloroflexota bacterium]
MSTQRVTTADLRQMKAEGRKIVMLTAYDAPMAHFVEAAGVPAILVGDSLGNTVLGYENTLPVTVDDILRHTQAVVRGTRRAIVIADMPFLSYQVSNERALLNAGQLIQEGGAQGVKLEGGKQTVTVTAHLVDAGIPVMGHLGLTPQSVHQLGGYRAQGRTLAEAEELQSDALALERAGAFALVLESIPATLAQKITESISIPTIGIGAGVHCDGQIQVLHDLLGLNPHAVHPRHAKAYAKLGDEMRAAVSRYVQDVESGTFPTREHSFMLPTEVARALRKETLVTASDED